MPTHYRGSPKQVRALNAYIPLLRAANSLAARTAAAYEAVGLTVSQFGVLEALLHLGPLCQRELAQKLLKSGGNITLVIDNLEKQDWVRRERRTDDRRMVTVRLTPVGRRLVARLFPAHAAAVAREMQHLSDSEQDELRRLCRKVGRREVTSQNKKGDRS
jgi:MarR family transcriptional regulator, 2-MHQ and catechol-resistance regulon repressor